MQSVENISITGTDMLPELFWDVFTYWSRIKGDDYAPLWERFQLNEVDPKLLPWSAVVDVLHDPLDFKYRFWGTARVRLLGAELTGEKVSAISDLYVRQGGIAEYSEVCERKLPILCETPVRTSSGRKVHFQAIRLPLRGLDGEVSHIFSVTNYKEITADHYDYYGTKPSPQ